MGRILHHSWKLRKYPCVVGNGDIRMTMRYVDADTTGQGALAERLDERLRADG